MHPHETINHTSNLCYCFNSRWNAMNLKSICNSFYINRVGGMYGKFYINKEGKYSLSRYGKQVLNKKRGKQSIQNILYKLAE